MNIRNNNSDTTATTTITDDDGINYSNVSMNYIYNNPKEQIIKRLYSDGHISLDELIILSKDIIIIEQPQLITYSEYSNNPSSNWTVSSSVICGQPLEGMDVTSTGEFKSNCP